MPRNLVVSTAPPVASKPVAKFGEMVSKPGEFVAKNPPPAVEPETLFPVKTELPAPELKPLLAPPPTLDAPLVQALRDYLEGRTDKAVEKLRGLDAPNQEQILRLLPALAHASRADLSGRSPTDAAVLASQIDSAAVAANKLANLKITKAAFAWRVVQYGVFDPVPEKHAFLPGGCGVLYLEIANAPSLPAELPAGGKGFVTRLTGRTAWMGADGQPLSSQPLEHTEYTRSPVRDFFLKIEFDVPKAPGPHTLGVEIIDPATKRKAWQTLDLTVAR